MPDDQEEEQKQELAGKSEASVAGPSAPKPKAAAKTPEQQVAEVRSIEQRRAAASLKRAEAAEKREADLRREHTAIMRELQILREGGVDEDTEDRVKRVVAIEEQARETLKTAHEAARLAAMQSLHVEYGIPLEDLEDYDSAEKMENVALRWALTRQRQAPSSEEEEPEPKPAARPGYVRGTGSSTVKSVPDMSDEEFRAYSAKLKADARAKLVRRGA